jgi:hypothetical protein
MPTLDINQALTFLDLLDPGGRHTIASEAPFGGVDGGPKWEDGATFEPQQRPYLIDDIQARQARGSNVYYSVNRPCPVWEQQGYRGKCNADDICVVRAFAFDIDLFTDADLINTKLAADLKPSIIINTGGGLHLIYLFNEFVNIKLYRPAINQEQEQTNTSIKSIRAGIAQMAHDFEALLRSIFPQLKIDNMSNIDRVMRLPGTVNYPKAEKRAKGQVEAQAHIAINNQAKRDLSALRSILPQRPVAPPAQPKRPYVQRANDPWTPYAKAKFCCEYIRDCGLADTNEWYSLNVMFPLMGEVINGTITMDEAEELFLEAVSGGERYGGPGRGLSYFRRQWRSHLHSSRNGQRTLGSLINACKANGMPTPWKDTVFWEKSYEEQLEAIKKLNQTVDADVVELFKRLK